MKLCLRQLSFQDNFISLFRVERSGRLFFNGKLLWEPKKLSLSWSEPIHRANRRILYFERFVIFTGEGDEAFSIYCFSLFLAFCNTPARQHQYEQVKAVLKEIWDVSITSIGHPVLLEECIERQG
ncbi:hypothetical protein I7I53_08220 [Histoplasma capsulatum var. duboisii H88]|uniref:Uncharacterized protein n=1 Tax=Ajellomyces capsulatus (strain H88) TaxID=544711 RepID=A0A8A1LKN5_AJEC8|nr:hypothetical protein I7I53_08220 [Histoplasma capsulatum var. duboisii H88]